MAPKTDKYRRRDLTVKHRHKDVGLSYGDMAQRRADRREARSLCRQIVLEVGK